MRRLQLATIAVVVMLTLSGCSFMGGETTVEPTENVPETTEVPTDTPTETVTDTPTETPTETETKTPTETETETPTETETATETETEDSPGSEEFTFPDGTSEDGIDGEEYVKTLSEVYGSDNFTYEMSGETVIEGEDDYVCEYTYARGNGWFFQNTDSRYVYSEEDRDGYLTRASYDPGTLAFRKSADSLPVPLHEQEDYPLAWFLRAGEFTFQGMEENDDIGSAVATYNVTDFGDTHFGHFERGLDSRLPDSNPSEVSLTGEMKIDTQGRIVDMSYTVLDSEHEANVSYDFTPTEPSVSDLPLDWYNGPETWNNSFAVSSAEFTEGGLALNVSQGDTEVTGADVFGDLQILTDSQEATSVNVSEGDTLYIGSKDGSVEISKEPISGVDYSDRSGNVTVLLWKESSMLYEDQYELGDE